MTKPHSDVVNRPRSTRVLDSLYTTTIMAPRRKPFSDFEKGQIWSLYKHAHWPLQRIADIFSTTKGPISNAISRLERELRTPPRRGRPPVITTRKRKRLVNRLTANAASRRLRIDQLAYLEDMRFHIQTLRKALQKEGY